MKPNTSAPLARIAALVCIGSLGLLTCVPAAVATQQDFVTSFNKVNNIYTNLNQQFPNTGSGTPGTQVGTPNATFFFDPATYTSPNAAAGANRTTNGTTFLLSSDTSGHDFTEIGSDGVASTLTIPIDLANVTSFHTLMAAYNGGSANVTFLGSGGAAETFSITLPDFYTGANINQSSAVNGSATNNLFDQTVFQVNDVGAGGTGNSATGGNGTYDLTEQSYVLSGAFANQTLTSVTITQTGGTPLLLGMTADVPEPSTWAAMLVGMGLLACVLRRRVGTRRPLSSSATFNVVGAPVWPARRFLRRRSVTAG